MGHAGTGSLLLGRGRCRDHQILLLQSYHGLKTFELITVTTSEDGEGKAKVKVHGRWNEVKLLNKSYFNTANKSITNWQKIVGIHYKLAAACMQSRVKA